MQILIVEDDTLTAQLYQKLLQQAGYEVQLAADTQQADTVLAQNTFDLMILDYQLPDQIGTDWLKTLRQDEKYLRLPVILVSHLHRDENLRHDRYVWFMEKPKLPQQIVTAVQQTIAHYS